ncbi:hypothetical protein MRAB57_4043 [Mycobacterium rhizamassiliense]|uniref:O-methyltransferase n=1 Tax=Mycobacterium rhizamassiliense TaxID=1841860 RepID=A0A2U3NXK5_9MYCO|nr:methyltransferase [Mycobacterium rhizamassiliense]SPM36203.1 hypothetical protein MRAB57_4043 [Mycobacterium rhizamassiliense]
MTQAESLHSDADAHAMLLDILFGYWSSHILRSLATLSVADHLADGPLTAAELAARTGGVTDRTFRLLRAGVAIGVLKSDGDEHFETTPLLDTMRKDSQRSLYPVVVGMTAPWITLSWRLLPEAIQSTMLPANSALGTDLFNYLEGNPEEGRQFSEMMAALTTLWAGDAADLIDTTNVGCAIDVGGASGSLLRLLQERNPRLRGVIFDRPNVIREIAPPIAVSDFGSRTDFVGGDFFASVPAGDLYLLKMILHDWDDEHCVTILQRCREAMEPGGRIVIIEMIMGDPQTPGFVALMDLNMLVACPDGRERTLDEFDALLRAAGLQRTETHPKPLGHSVIEACAT